MASDTERNYKSGAWGKGELDAEALAKKYGLDRSQEGRGEGHVWGRKADGSEVYIGKTNMGLASNKDLIAGHAKQANSAEVDHSAVPEDLSSYGDIKGALLTEWDAGGSDTPAPPTAPEEPVGQSEKLVTARTRVQQYEEDVLGGRKVFGKGSFEQNDGPSFLERYKLKLDEKYERDPNDGLYVKREDADRYRAQMADYNKEKAEYDAKYGGQ